MTALDDLPGFSSFLGFDLKTGSLMIAAISIVHPMAYGCTFFMSISYLIITIWVLVALFMAASIALIFGINNSDDVLCAIWIWYAVIFVALMMILMTLLVLVFTSKKQKKKVFITILGMLWYIVIIYFILVVNSYRKQLVKEQPILSEKIIGMNKVYDDHSISSNYILASIHSTKSSSHYVTEDLVY